MRLPWLPIHLAQVTRRRMGTISCIRKDQKARRRTPKKRATFCYIAVSTLILAERTWFMRRIRVIRRQQWLRFSAILKPETESRRKARSLPSLRSWATVTLDNDWQE